MKARTTISPKHFDHTILWRNFLPPTLQFHHDEKRPESEFPVPGFKTQQVFIPLMLLPPQSLVLGGPIKANEWCVQTKRYYLKDTRSTWARSTVSPVTRHLWRIAWEWKMCPLYVLKTILDDQKCETYGMIPLRRFSGQTNATKKVELRK